MGATATASFCSNLKTICTNSDHNLPLYIVQLHKFFVVEISRGLKGVQDFETLAEQSTRTIFVSNLFTFLAITTTTITTTITVAKKIVRVKGGCGENLCKLQCTCQTILNIFQLCLYRFFTFQSATSLRRPENSARHNPVTLLQAASFNCICIFIVFH